MKQSDVFVEASLMGLQLDAVHPKAVEVLCMRPHVVSLQSRSSVQVGRRFCVLRGRRWAVLLRTAASR